MSFTSASTTSVTENTGGTFYTAQATASNGQAVTYAIAGGTDAARFTMAADGTLAFAAQPDFERPGDANGDNLYQITIRASAGNATAQLGLSVTVTNSKEGIAVRRIATGFTDPVCIDFLNERLAPTAGPQGLIAVGERGGKIYQIDGTTGARTEWADVFANKAPAEMIECKSFLRNRTYYAGLYAVVREADGRAWMQRYDPDVLAEMQILPSGAPPAEVRLINGPDGEFYMAIGSNSGPAAQDPASRLGKFFRLIQADPYAGASIQPGYFTPSVIGDGLRAPGGGSAVDGRILLSDRGATAEHELSFVLPGVGPFDFGWPNWEGTVPMVGSPPAAGIGPSLVYPVGTGARQGTGILSGWVYDGPATELQGRYVFGDETGLIWSIPVALLIDGRLHGAADLEDRTADFVPDAGTIDSPVGFAADDMGRFYILDSDGEVFRVDGS